MSRNPDASNVSRREFLAAAGTIAAASSIAAAKDSGPGQPPPPPAAADYNVVIDAQHATFAYTTDQPAANTPAYHLRIPVAKGSTVKWKVTSPSAKRCVGIYFPKDTPLIDAFGRPLYAVLWSETEEGANQLKLTVDPDASGAYEYVVIVFDRQSYATQRDDPKMIVGSGNLELKEQIASAKSDLQELRKELSSKPNLETQIKEIGNIESKLTEVIDELR